MSSSPRIRGVLAPVVTPFRSDLSIDMELFATHCRRLLEDGVGLAVFGTNSEATSVSMRERMDAIDALRSAGLPGGRMMPGVGYCSIAETVEMTRFVLDHGIESVLMLPPYFYKEADEDGLFAHFSTVIERVGSADLKVYLYNIPQYTQVPLTPALVGRLLEAYPGTVAGLKDSSGDWANTKALLDRFGASGFDVFTGSEVFLSNALKLGGAGCISATANVNPRGIRSAYDARGTWQMEEAQARADRVRQAFQSRPLIAAMKHYLASRYQSSDWRRLRPPLSGLSSQQASVLDAELSEIGFE